MNPTSIPAPLKKRRVAKALTAGTAVVAGAAVAATAFSVIQNNNAFFNVVVLDNVDDGDVEVNSLEFTDVAYLDKETLNAGDKAAIEGQAEGTSWDVMTFTNDAKDDRAKLTLESIVYKERSGGTAEPSPELYNALYVRVEQAGSDTVVYQGPLRSIDFSQDYVIPADGSISFDVFIWSTEEFTETAGEDDYQLVAGFDVRYGYEGLDLDPDPQPEPVDDVPNVGFDPIDDGFEEGHDDFFGDGEQPSAG